MSNNVNNPVKILRGYIDKSGGLTQTIHQFLNPAGNPLVIPKNHHVKSAFFQNEGNIMTSSTNAATISLLLNSAGGDILVANGLNSQAQGDPNQGLANAAPSGNQAGAAGKNDGTVELIVDVEDIDPDGATSPYQPRLWVSLECVISPSRDDS